MNKQYEYLTIKKDSDALERRKTIPGGGHDPERMEISSIAISPLKLTPLTASNTILLLIDVVVNCSNPRFHSSPCVPDLCHFKNVTAPILNNECHMVVKLFNILRIII